MTLKINIIKRLWAFIIIVAACATFLTFINAGDDSSGAGADGGNLNEGSQSETSQGKDDKTIDGKGLSGFLQGYSQMKKVGELLVAYYPMAGKIAVGHKSYGVSALLPYAPDFECSGGKTAFISCKSKDLGVDVFVSRFEAQKGVKASSCYEGIKKELLKKLKPGDFTHEKQSLDEPVVWRYELLKQVANNRQMYEFALWTFKIKNGWCYNYKLAVETDHSEKRDKFVNSVLKYAATFDTDFDEKMMKKTEQKNKKETPEKTQ